MAELIVSLHVILWNSTPRISKESSGWYV